MFPTSRTTRHARHFAFRHGACYSCAGASEEYGAPMGHEDVIDVSETLGKRIVEAARMAVAVHLYQAAHESVRIIRQQQVVIGGAGPRLVTDDELSAAAAHGRAENPSARPASTPE